MIGRAARADGPGNGCRLLDTGSSRQVNRSDSPPDPGMGWTKDRAHISRKSAPSEYLVKFYLFWDALTRQRSDGALIRLSASVGSGESEQDVETRLLEFSRTIHPQLSRYIPD